MNLSNLIRDVWGDLGMTESFIATSGSATMVENTAWNVREDVPDDNYATDYTVIVNRDAGGAGAAPEDEFSRVTAYNSTTFQYTIDTVTAIGAGDDIVLVNNEIPLRDMILAANRAFKEFGVVPAVPDTSLTTASNQTEYALPVAVKRGIIQYVAYQGQADDANDNQWIEVNWKVEPGTYGSTGLLYLPQLEAGRTIKIVYDGVHPELTAYNSEIAETIPDAFAKLAVVKSVLRWYVGNNEGGDPFWLSRYNEAIVDYQAAEMKWRSYIDKPRKAGKYKVFGTSSVSKYDMHDR